MSDEHRHLELQFKAKKKVDTLYAVQFSIHERLSQPWVARITARSPEFDIPLHHIVGFSAGMRATVGPRTFTWTGVVRNMELVRASRTRTHSTYYLELVPNLWLLSKRRGHRIFQHKTTEEIVTEILKEWAIEFQWNLRDEHPTHEYRVQYGESDLAFISRLLEEDGIAYHFDQKEQGKERLTRVLFQERPRRGGTHRLQFHDSVPDQHVGFWATKLHVGQASRSGNATLYDFDFRRPDQKLKSDYASEVSNDPEKKREQYLYSPGGFLIDNAPGGGDTPVADDKSVARHNDDRAKALAKQAVQAMQFKRRFVEFETNNLELNPGQHVLLDGNPHPRADIHEQDMMIVESNALGNASGEFQMLVTAVFDKDPFTVPQTFSKPRIDGVQSAIVVGPKGEEIYTDEFGRVRVRFHWDREGKYDDNRTCWLRVNQGWAGPGYGAMNLPRVGHEVLVEFLDGDPDMPVVVGRVYNATSQFPYVLPDHKTHSAWKTQSSPFKDGYFNELFVDDQIDNEPIYIQAQRNMMKLVKNNETRRIGKERLDVVGEHRLGVVRNYDAYHVGDRHLVQIIEENDLKILQKEDPLFVPEETFMELKNEKITLTTGHASIILDGPDITIQADKGIRFSAKKDLRIKGKMLFLNCSMAMAKDVATTQKADDQVRKLEDGDRTKVEILELLNKELKKEVLKRGWGFQVHNYKRKKPRKDESGQRNFMQRGMDWLMGRDVEAADAPSKSLTDPNAKKRHSEWKAPEILDELNNSRVGRKVVENMPPDVTVKPLMSNPPPHCRYNPKTNTVYVAKGISSKEAAPLVAKALAHADQVQNRGRPYDAMDRLEMEVDAKNVELDVWAQTGRAPNPKMEKRYAARQKDPAAFDEAVRKNTSANIKKRAEERNSPAARRRRRARRRS
jgi:type VI secretion system secreted protein VgrG